MGLAPPNIGLFEKPKFMKSIIFDLDGTLLDTLGDLAAAMNRVLKALELPEQEKSFYNFAVGNGMRKLVERSLPDHADDELIDRALGMMQNEYAGSMTADTRAYEGILPMLKQLRMQDVPLYILTNKPDDQMRFLVNHYFGDTHFVEMFGALPDGLLKPDPTVALRYVKESDKPLSDWIFVGDSCVDMQTAKAAGMMAVGVSWGFRPRAELEMHGANHIIDNPSELLDFLY